jgi:hypothetical protein
MEDVKFESSGDTNAQLNRFLKFQKVPYKNALYVQRLLNDKILLLKNRNYKTRFKLEELSKMTPSPQRYLNDNSLTTND